MSANDQTPRSGQQPEGQQPQTPRQTPRQTGDGHGQTPYQQTAPQYNPYGQRNPAGGYGSYSPYTPYPQGSQFAPYQVEQPWNVLSIIGFILAFVIPPAGLIISIIALIQQSRSKERGRGLAIAGIVVGAVIVVLTIVVVFIALGLIAELAQHPELYNNQSYSYRDAGMHMSAFAPLTSLAPIFAAALHLPA